MRWTGKIIGLLVGVWLAGPMGMILGIILGHLYDIGYFQRWLGPVMRPQSQMSVQQIFFDSTFTIMGHLSKADGRVSESEIREAQAVMERMGLNPNMKREAIQLFNRGKQADFNLTAAMERLKRACWLHPNLLHTFLDIQIQIALAEGYMTAGKRNVLKAICANLGMSDYVLSQFERQAQAERSYKRGGSHGHHQYQHHRQQQQQQHQQYQYHHHSGSQQNRPNGHLNDAYQVLGLQASATQAEIKKAYRRLMSKHHPDKLMSQGLPPEMMKMATEKTQKIKDAYEAIKRVRGFN